MASPLEALSDCLQGMTGLFPEGWLMTLRRTSREQENNLQSNQETSPQNNLHLQNNLQSNLQNKQYQSLREGMWASRRVWGTLKTNRGGILMPPDRSRPRGAWMST